MNPFFNILFAHTYTWIKQHWAILWSSKFHVILLKFLNGQGHDITFLIRWLVHEWLTAKVFLAHVSAPLKNNEKLLVINQIKMSCKIWKRGRTLTKYWSNLIQCTIKWIDKKGFRLQCLFNLDLFTTNLK